MKKLLALFLLLALLPICAAQAETLPDIMTDSQNKKKAQVNRPGPFLTCDRFRSSLQCL